MSIHLPECPIAERRGTINPVGCICDRLRQCEQRVKDETWMSEYARLAREFADGAEIEGREDAVRWALRQLENVRRLARDEVLDAARKAVAEAPIAIREPAVLLLNRDVALAAIDALREKEK